VNQVVLLHGFCGLPEDWSPVVAELRKINSSVQIQAPHLWREVCPSVYPDLNQAGTRLSQLVSGQDLTLVGYSLGGRLALHWPQDQWHRIKKMILISVHGGISSLVEKQQRLKNDESWAQKFLNLSWLQVQQEWNSQPVFTGDKVRVIRNEKDFLREELAGALRFWSLGRQKEVLLSLDTPSFSVSYLYGERDQKFSSYAEELQKSSKPWAFLKITNAGHSVHLSHPERVAESIL
jgi:2-succinyl-6-hydroxy-2,4-cyclohexadiene-1-carboxylate synthase